MKKVAILVVLAFAVFIAACSSAQDSHAAEEENLASVSQPAHSWYNYRWQKPVGSELQLSVVSNLSNAWAPFLTVAKNDWSVSSVLSMNVTKGRNGANMNCVPVQGTIQVCNYSYGTTGWSGLTSVGIVNGYIVQATVKMNQSYTLTNDWKQYVMCHELGHSLGLAHADTDTTNPDTGSCMDMTSNPAVNKQPNAHDYEHLEIIYADAVAAGSPAAATPTPLALSAHAAHVPSEWGMLRYKLDDEENYIRRVAENEYVLTHVTLSH